MTSGKEASPGTPGDGYQDTNERDIDAKQHQGVSGSEAARDESVDLSEVAVLPGTGGPDDVGDEAVPADYDRTGHAAEHAENPMLDDDGTPVENPSG